MIRPSYKKTVPLTSLRFAATVTMNEAPADVVTVETDDAAGVDTDDEADGDSPPPPYPITIRARTNGEALQGYWGRCIHDMSGFIMPSGPLPIDWNHAEEEDIGVADTIAIDADGLSANGRLIPFTSGDRAAQLIYKGQQGVPYQASIVMSPDGIVITEVPEGTSFNVNGQDVLGPLIVFSQWTIDGITILPYGADGATSVQFTRGENVNVDVTILSPPVQETSTMTEATKLPPSALEFSRDEMLRWKTHFGPQAVDWYVDGSVKSFEDAALLFGRNLQTEMTAMRTAHDATVVALTTERDTLKTERDEFKKKAEFRRGAWPPANVDPPADKDATPPEKDAANPAHFGRTKGMIAFMGSIAKRLPNPNATAQ